MLEIHPVETKDDQKKFCTMCHIEYDADLLCYAAYVDGIMVGCCQFTLKDGIGNIKEMANTTGIEDENALFVMGRATLNFIDLCGVKSAVYTGERCNNDLLRLIGFKKSDAGEWKVDLNGFFDAPCKHEK